MFKRFITWFTDLFKGTKESTDSILDAFENASEDVRDFVKDIREAINDDKKQFLVEVNVGSDTKIRPLKAAMETALMDAMIKSNPECSDWTVKSFYHKNA